MSLSSNQRTDAKHTTCEGKACQNTSSAMPKGYGEGVVIGCTVGDRMPLIGDSLIRSLLNLKGHPKQKQSV
jgi:hypothetical protein